MRVQTKSRQKLKRVPRQKFERQANQTWDAETANSEWRKKFKKTFDFWQSLNPYLYKDLFEA